MRKGERVRYKKDGSEGTFITYLKDGWIGVALINDRTVKDNADNFEPIEDDTVLKTEVTMADYTEAMYEVLSDEYLVKRFPTMSPDDLDTLAITGLLMFKELKKELFGK